MRYYIDFEFNEHFITKGFWKWKKTFHTIEPISLGIVCEDGRELEIIFNDYDVKAAWNKFDLKLPKEHGDKIIKEYWLRDNVLDHIQGKLFQKLNTIAKTQFAFMYEGYKGFKRLLKEKGKSRKEAKQLIQDFCQELEPDGLICFETRSAPEFYAYFADYDWICFCQIFGRMIDLPNDFPMYCNDLKQLMEEKCQKRNTTSEMLKKRKDYPKQTNEHDCLEDSKWNKELHQFLLKF